MSRRTQVASTSNAPDPVYQDGESGEDPLAGDPKLDPKIQAMGTSVEEISDKYARLYGSFNLQLKGAASKWKAAEARAQKAESDLQRLVGVIGSTPDSLLAPSPSLVGVNKFATNKIKR